MKKNTLMILAVSAILGAMMVGCSSSTDGNTDPGATATSTGANDKKPMAGGAASTANTTTPATTDANAPAAGNTPAAGNEPAKK